VEIQDYASLKLREDVIDKGLCPLCGGCASGCPYLGEYRGRIVQLDCCTLTDGSCYRNCPRTATDFDVLSQTVFGQPFSSEELGVIQGAYLARASDTSVRAAADGGGVVPALLSASVDAGLIAGVLTTGLSSNGRTGLLSRNVIAAIAGPETPIPILARNPADVVAHTTAPHRMARTLAGFNSVAKETGERFAMTCLPCQVASMRKRLGGPADSRTDVSSVALLVSEFCAAKRWLEPGEDRQIANKACSYCWDLTGEFADVSVGSGRAKYPDWNTVFIRTDAGKNAFDAAVESGAIETQPLPEESLQAEKKASWDKKKRAVRNLAELSGSKDDLGYLGMPARVVDALRAGE